MRAKTIHKSYANHTTNALTSYKHIHTTYTHRTQIIYTPFTNQSHKYTSYANRVKHTKQHAQILQKPYNHQTQQIQKSKQDSYTHHTIFKHKVRHKSYKHQTRRIHTTYNNQRTIVQQPYNVQTHIIQQSYTTYRSRIIHISYRNHANRTMNIHTT